VFQEHRHQFSVYIVWCPECTGTVVSISHIVRCPAQRDSNVRQSGVSRTSSAVLHVVRCPECTGTTVSVSLVFQEHLQQFSVYSLVYRVHRDSSVSQSGVSRTSSSIFLYIVRYPEYTGTAVSVSIAIQEHFQQFSVHIDSSVSQSGVSTTSSLVFCI